MVLPADQLERVGDPVHVRDSGQAAQVEPVEGVDVADEPDDGADDAAADERLAPDALDALGDVFDLLVGGVGCHDHDHGGVPLWWARRPASYTRTPLGGGPGAVVCGRVSYACSGTPGEVAKT